MVVFVSPFLVDQICGSLGSPQVDAYRQWISRSIETLRSKDCAHLITIGSEGPTPWPNYVKTDLAADHAMADFIAIHVWPQNWGWYDPASTNARAASGTPASAQRGGLDFAWAESRRYVHSAVQVSQDFTAIGEQRDGCVFAEFLVAVLSVNGATSTALTSSSKCRRLPSV